MKELHLHRADEVTVCRQLIIPHAKSVDLSIEEDLYLMISVETQRHKEEPTKRDEPGIPCMQ